MFQADPRIDSLAVFAPATVRADLAVAGIAVDSWPRHDRWIGHRALRGKLALFRPDVVFTPTARSLKIQSPQVIMVRNMEPLEVPAGRNPAGEALRNVLRARAARAACGRAARIIAVSNHVKGFLTRTWSIDEAKIGVVYHGVDGDLATEARIPQGLGALRGTRFLFTAGSIRPARRLEVLIQALGSLEPGSAPPLVVAGAVDPGMGGYQASLLRLARHLGVQDRIVWTGRLPAAEIRWCYENCGIFIMTSRTEACPNTALEAMAHGCLCIAPGHDPYPEFYRDGALYYDPKESGNLGSCIHRALQLSEQHRDALSLRASQRSVHFTWSASAEGTISQIEMAAAGKRKAGRCA